MIWHLLTIRSRRPRRLLLGLTVLIFVAAAARAIAAPETPSPDHPFSEEVIGEYLDEYHTYLLGKIKGPTVWFDNFFGDQRLEEDDLPASFVRFRAVARYTEGEGMTFPMRLRANINLPRVNRRLRLVVFGGNREEDRLRETDNTLDPSLMGPQQEEHPNLGLRYLIYKTLRDRFDFGSGLSLSSPITYNSRMRYERLIQISTLYITRFTENFFWDSHIGLGETTRLDFEKTLSPETTGRFSLFGTYSGDKPALQWGVESNFYRQLSAKSAVALDLGAYGDGVNTGQVANYRIATRYRRNFYRSWLFFEIEPEVIFPLTENGTRDSIVILTTVLEIQFVT